MLRLGYNTNGFPQHRIDDICRILAELGYSGIAITPDVLQLNPFTTSAGELVALRSLLGDLDLGVAIETGARFILDARRKHWPTLLDEPVDAERRLDLLRRCLDIALALGAETFSFWAGRAPEGQSFERSLERLGVGATALLDHAPDSGVTVCLEPEPGMAVASLAELLAFLRALDRDSLKVMLDIGHLPVTESAPPEDAVVAVGSRIGGVQLDDSAGGVHEHRLFGEGEIDFAPVCAALDTVGFKGLASVELPRHDHDPVSTARASIAFFRELGVVC